MFNQRLLTPIKLSFTISPDYQQTKSRVRGLHQLQAVPPSPFPAGGPSRTRTAPKWMTETLSPLFHQQCTRLNSAFDTTRDRLYAGSSTPKTFCIWLSVGPGTVGFWPKVTFWSCGGSSNAPHAATRLRCRVNHLLHEHIDFRAHQIQIQAYNMCPKARQALIVFLPLTVLCCTVLLYSQSSV